MLSQSRTKGRRIRKITWKKAEKSALKKGDTTRDSKRRYKIAPRAVQIKMNRRSSPLPTDMVKKNSAVKIRTQKIPSVK